MSNKRNLSDDEDFDEPTSSKRINSDNNETLIDTNYYIIKKSKSSMLKNETMSLDNSDTSFDKPFKDNFKKRSFDSFSNISFKETEISKKKNLDSKLSYLQNNSDSFPYKIKLPSSSRNDFYNKQEKNKFDYDNKKFISNKNSFDFQKNDSLKSTKELKETFLNMSKSKNLNLLYNLKLSFGNHVVETRSINNFDELEKNIYKLAIEKLKNEKKNDDMFIEYDEDSSVIDEIKGILRYKDSNLLFKTEIPVEYLRKFKKKIPTNWFDKVSSSASFKLEKIGAGDLITIKLIE